MKKSIALLSALVVSTTFIVNCQKAPDKRRVRPSGGAATGSQSDVVDEKAKLPAKVCSKDILDLYSAVYKNKSVIDKTVITAASTETEKESLRKLGVETLGKCDDMITALKAETNEGCYRDNGVKDLSNALTSSNVQNFCNAIGKKLKTDVDLTTSYSDAAKAKEDKMQDTSKLEKEYLGKEFKVSEEGINLMTEGNTALGLYLLEGTVKSDQTSLDQALAASKTVCTALGKGIAKDQQLESPTLKFNTFTRATKEELAQIGIQYKGEAIVLNFALYDKNENTTLGSLLCLNLELETLKVKQLDTVLGKVISAAPAQVTTEVTGGASGSASSSTATKFTSADLAAAQPAGSPQEANLNAGMKQTIDNANQVVGQKVAEQKAASQTVVAAAPVASAPAQAKVEKVEEEKQQEEVAAPAVSATAVVVSTNNSGGASAAVSATAQAGQKVSKEDLAMMKEKADRLEKEAKDAEAEVKSLTDAKAKAEDIDQAKAKAKITRESANSAKAEYDAAAKQA